LVDGGGEPLLRGELLAKLRLEGEGWDPQGAWVDAVGVEGVDLLVALAGGAGRFGSCGLASNVILKARNE